MARIIGDILFAAVMFLFAWLDLKRGYVVGGRGGTPIYRRQTSPLTFWFEVLLFAMIGSWFTFLAIVGIMRL